ncbi:hypothetical protein [Actinophytocola xinjiangensis]|nr:hypothetical protein [Actinophytocola xinjiangensis]
MRADDDQTPETTEPPGDDTHGAAAADLPVLTADLVRETLERTRR